MADLKITLRNKTNPEKPSEIFIGNTRLTGLFANRLGMNATINVRNPDVDNRKNLEREVSSREYSEPDYISGTILMEAVKEYLKGKGVYSGQGEVILEDDELNRKIFSDLYTQLNNILPELEKNRAELGGIFTQVEGENPGHRKLATDLMQKAMETATINLIKGEKVNWKIDLKNEAAKHAVELTWSNEIVNKVDGWLTRVVSWFKRTFENLVMKKGLGEDTYLKCSLVDDKINGENKEAGELLKEYYIRSVNEPLDLAKFLTSKGVVEEGNFWKQITDLNDTVTTHITQPSSINYKNADSKISARYGEYQNIAKQISEQNFYKGIENALKNETDNGMKTADPKLTNLSKEVFEKSDINKLQTEFNLSSTGKDNKAKSVVDDLLTGRSEFEEASNKKYSKSVDGDDINKLQENLKGTAKTLDINNENKHSNQLNISTGNSIEFKANPVSNEQKLAHLLDFITKNTNHVQSKMYTYDQSGSVKVGGKDVQVTLPRYVLDAYDPTSAKNSTGAYNLTTVVSNLKKDIGNGDSAATTITNKITASRNYQKNGYDNTLTTDGFNGLTNADQLERVLQYGTTKKPEPKGKVLMREGNEQNMIFNPNDNTNKTELVIEQVSNK